MIGHWKSTMTIANNLESDIEASNEEDMNQTPVCGICGKASPDAHIHPICADRTANERPKNINSPPAIKAEVFCKNCKSWIGVESHGTHCPQRLESDTESNK